MVGHDRLGGALRPAFTDEGQRGAGDDRECKGEQLRSEHREGVVVQQRPVDGAGQCDGLHDRAHRAQGAEDQCDDGGRPDRRDMGRQLGVDEAGAGGANGAHRVEAVLSTWKVGPRSPSVGPGSAKRAMAASSQVVAVRFTSGASIRLQARAGDGGSQVREGGCTLGDATVRGWRGAMRAVAGRAGRLYRRDIRGGGETADGLPGRSRAGGDRDSRDARHHAPGGRRTAARSSPPAAPW